MASLKIVPLLLISFTCFRACLSDDSQIIDLAPTQCRTPVNAAPWWSPLVLGEDPCQLYQNLKKDGVFTLCCKSPIFFAVEGLSFDRQQCGPCTPHTYNLVVACMACVDNILSFSSTIPTVNNGTIFIFKNLEFILPTFSDFNQGTRTLDQYPFPLPPWTNAPLSQDLFNPQAVVDLAASIQPSQPATSINSTSSVTTTPPITNSNPSEPTTSAPQTPPATVTGTVHRNGGTQPLSGSRRAAAIAGIALGIIVVLVQVVIAFFVIRRRRRNAREARLTGTMSGVGWRRI